MFGNLKRAIILNDNSNCIALPSKQKKTAAKLFDCCTHIHWKFQQEHETRYFPLEHQSRNSLQEIGADRLMMGVFIISTSWNWVHALCCHNPQWQNERNHSNAPLPCF
ncbi:unnamed protein product [Natator depressus]